MRINLAILVIFALLLASCSASTSIGEAPTGENETSGAVDDGATTATGTSASETRLLELLALVPRSALSDSIVYLSDWELAGEQFGMGPPGDCTNEERLRNYMLELNGLGGINSPEAYTGQVFFGASSFVDLETEFGFSVCDITGVAEGGQLPHAATSFTVTTPVDLIDDRLRADPEWGPDLMVVNEGAEDEYYQWTDEPLRQYVERRTSMRSLGRGGAMLVADGFVVRSASTEPVEAIVTGDSLDDSTLAIDLVAALASENVHTAFITQPQRATLGLFELRASFEDVAAELESLRDMALEPYSLLGVGVGYERDERRTVLTVIMLNRNAENAVENVERFRRIVEESGPISDDAMWADYFTISSAEARGNLTVTRLIATDGERPVFSFALETFYRRDALFSTS